MTGRPAPMWDDDATTPPAEPMSEIDLLNTRSGDSIRIVNRHGITVQGVVESVRLNGNTFDNEFGRNDRREAATNSHRRATNLRIGGRWWAVAQVERAYSVDGGVNEIAPPIIELSDEDVRDRIADLSRRSSTSASDKPNTVGYLDIARSALGFDPSALLPTDRQFSHASRSVDAYWNEHIKVGTIKRSLDRLVDEGILVKVTDRADDDNHKYVHFPYRSKSGYVLADALQDSKLAVAEAKREQRRAVLRAQAASAIAEKYAAEVEAETQRLLAEEGL